MGAGAGADCVGVGVGGRISMWVEMEMGLWRLLWLPGREHGALRGGLGWIGLLMVVMLRVWRRW